MDRRRFFGVGIGVPAAFLLRSRLSGQQHVSSAGSGLVDLSLTAASTWLSLAGRNALLYAYNAQVPGPLIEARAGDTVRLQLRNDLPEPTNLHYHGLHVPPTGNADNSFLEIPSGETLAYEFTLPADHAAGTFWYHPHIHGTVARQVSRGLAGVFVVRGELDALPEIRDTPEYFLVLQDFNLYPNGQVREPTPMERMQGREGPLVTASGRAYPSISIPQGGWVRLRIVNASSSRFYRLRLEEHPLYLIATDGGALPSPNGADEILLVPGERVDVLVQGQRAEGSYRLLSLPYSRGGMGMMGMMGGMGAITNSSAAEVLATVNYGERATRTWSLPPRLVTVERLPPPASPPKSFVLGTGMGMGMGMARAMTFVINGKPFDPGRIDTRVLLNTVEDWEILNPHGMDHPFHVHTNPFQVLDNNGAPEQAWRDTFLVRAGSRVRLRLQFKDYSGTTVYHCHILDHSDLGMMATLQIA